MLDGDDGRARLLRAIPDVESTEEERYRTMVLRVLDVVSAALASTLRFVPVPGRQMQGIHC